MILGPQIGQREQKSGQLALTNSIVSPEKGKGGPTTRYAVARDLCP